MFRQANNSIVLRSDQIWVFGPISNGVLAEIVLAKKKNKPIFYYKIENSHKIIPISEEEIEMEKEVEQYKSLTT